MGELGLTPECISLYLIPVVEKLGTLVPGPGLVLENTPNLVRIVLVPPVEDGVTIGEVLGRRQGS